MRISTKIGYFPDGDRTAHSLDPARLRQAIRRSIEDLTCRPAVVLLHNPETTLTDLEPVRGRDVVSGAAAVLQQACMAGDCQAWGISSWAPARLLTALDSGRLDAFPAPDVVMVRGGLLVNAATMQASERLCSLLGAGHARRWAMSPFGGHADAAMWDRANPHLFLSPGQQASTRQAAFRLAYELPGADRVAVSTNSARHLDELLDATTLDVDHAKIAKYRRLLTARQAGTEQCTEPVDQAQSGA